MMKNVILILLLLFSACTSDTTEIEAVHDTQDSKIGEIEHIETLFDETGFTSEIHKELLYELEICDTNLSQTANCATCTPDFFKISEYKTGTKIEDAFLLQIKALTILKGQNQPLPMRHLIAFERVNGTLVKVNGFRGNLIATRESDLGAKDLIVRFYIPDDEAFLNCLFEWSGEQYKFKTVEAIHGAGGNGPVKEALKDSISKEVYTSLMSNSMLF